MVKFIQSQENKALSFFRKRGGIVRTSDALSHGIYPHTLYEMRKEGRIEPLVRGINHLVEVPLPQRYELIIVSMLKIGRASCRERV